MSNADGTSESTAKPSSAPFWISLVALLIFLLLFGGYLSVAGIVSGEEFSPDDFSRRHFSYNVMPIFGVEIRGLSHQNSASVLEQTLITDNWITPITKTPQTWHLVHDSISKTSSPDFDASILVKLLERSDSDDNQVWQIWTDDHPQNAKTFWPAVAELARNNLYWAIPDIMELASTEKDGGKNFSARLDYLMSLAFLTKASELAATGSDKSALDYFAGSIKHLKSKDAYVQRSKSYTSLGEDAKSKKDLAESEKHPSMESLDKSQ